jgi:membrane associated rhomboid family serine protease
MFPLYDTVRSRRFPFVTWMLVLLNGLVFYHELTMSEAELHRFILDWGLIPAQLALDSADSWLRILSSMFLHGGWFHIISNLWILIIFGDNVEDRMGGMRYLIFYLLSGTAAALLQAGLYPDSPIPMIGASGAIAGVLGAYLILYPRARVASIVPIVFIFTVIELPALIFLGFWFISQLFQGWLALQGADMGGVAWWAHIGGFIFGLVMVRLFVSRRY